MWPWLGLEAAVARLCQYCSLGLQSPRGGRSWWQESPSPPLAGQGSGVSYSPAVLSDTHLPSPFCLLGTGWTVCISKIPFLASVCPCLSQKPVRAQE